MATLTAQSKATLMNIIRLVTYTAVTCRHFELGVKVTLLAGRRGMHSNQGKYCHVMLELDSLAPPDLIMALLALLSFLPLVDIVRSVAIGTTYLKLFRVNVSSVAG